MMLDCIRQAKYKCEVGTMIMLGLSFLAAIAAAIASFFVETPSLQYVVVFNSLLMWLVFLTLYTIETSGDDN